MRLRHSIELALFLQEYLYQLSKVSDASRLAQMLCDWDIFDQLYDDKFCFKLLRYWRQVRCTWTVRPVAVIRHNTWYKVPVYTTNFSDVVRNIAIFSFNTHFYLNVNTVIKYTNIFRYLSYMNTFNDVYREILLMVVVHKTQPFVIIN